MRTQSIHRRAFLSRIAAAAGAAMSVPGFVAGNALGSPGVPPASDRIVTGHIGVGGRGSQLLHAMRLTAGAVCDVDASHLRRAAASVGPEAGAYKDYRRILDRNDIDAVVIATPDHWHALQAVHACQAGKDVYVEAPSARTIAEGRCMVAAARRHGRVIQVGSEGRSTPAAQAARRYIRSGCLGKISAVTCWHYPNPVGGQPASAEPPRDLDWNMWLGPAPWVPYNPDRCHFHFRWLLDLGGGWLCGRGAHIMSVVLWCLDRDGSGPVRVRAAGAPPARGIWDCPPALEVVYEFERPDWTLTWSQPGAPDGGAPFGMKFWGEKETLVVTGGDGDCGAEEKAYALPGGVDGRASPGHVEDWLRSIRTRAATIMPIEAAHAVATLGIIGTIAYRLGRPLAWDAAAERFAGDAEANLCLEAPYRAPYSLGSP